MKQNALFRVLLICIVGLLMTASAFAQQMNVTGAVSDAIGEPIMGANVYVKGSSNGATTDINGRYSLKVNKGDIISASFIGYITEDLTANTAVVNFILKENSEILDDVVVIGYGVAKKNDLTGSVTAIKPDPINKGVVVNAQDMIAGKIAGVNVTSAGGTPGGGATIRIRGGSSLNASNDPLIVIDGLAMDNDGVKGLSNPLSMVNPADIESFTVLKDASATAIYGSRGSNGVIIITTKKGRVQDGKGFTRPQISYNGNVSVSQVLNTVDVMNGQQYGEFIEGIWGVDSDAWRALTKQTNADGSLKTDANGNYLYNNTDWQDQIYRTAVSTDHNITISGGIKKMPYRVTLGYTNQDGIIKTSNFERYTASLNLSPSLLENHLKLNLNAKGMIAKNRYADGDAISSAVYMDPTKPVRSSDSQYENFGGYWQWTKVGAFNDNSWPLTHDTNTTDNPVALLNLRDDKATSKSFVGNAEFDYTVHGLEDLHLHANLGADFSTGKQTTVNDPMSAQNTYYGWNGWEKIDKYNLSLNAYAQYMKDINKDNHFDIMGGYEWQHFHRETTSAGSGWYPETNLDSTLANTPYNATSNISKTEHYLVSFFGRANYSLMDRYMLTATVRYDGSSRFKEHWATFPSFALGWKIKEEAFLKDVEAVSDLKLRLGYGQTGQQEGIGDYNYFASYNQNTGVGSTYPLLNGGILYRPDAYNADLKWETTTTYNVGLDFGFFNDRLTASADYYYRETTDLINTTYVSAGSNFRNQVNSNIGSLENKGVELSLTYRPIQTKDWTWEVAGNVTYNKNEITELTGDKGYYVATGGISAGTGINCQAHAVGHPASSYYVYQQVYDDNNMPIEGVFVDRNADGIINSDDRYFYKSPNAPWTAGFTSKLTYKQFDFSFSLRASFNNYVFNDLEAGSSNCSKNEIWNPFACLTNRPTMTLDKNWKSYDYVLSDYFVQNGSFLKCDNITLGYSFNKICNAPISGRVYATVSNVFTITDYKGLDPEVSGGIDNSIYPRPFTALLGLSLNF